MSSKLSKRRATVRKPKICVSSPATSTGIMARWGPGCRPPPPPPPKTCWAEIHGASTEWPYGAVTWWACREDQEHGEDFEIATLELDPQIMGYHAETPTNCAITGLYIFDADPPPGLLTATVYFKWWSGVECTNQDTKTYP